MNPGPAVTWLPGVKARASWRRMAAAEAGAVAAPRRVSTHEAFDAMTTLFGGLNSNTYTGYAGDWWTGEHTQLPPGSAAPVPASFFTRSVNLRVWRQEDPATRAVRQVNLYQDPSKMATSQTRWSAYLAGQDAGRGDGYGVRSWTFAPDSDLVQSDTSAWPDEAATPFPERAMRVLSVPGRAALIANGALPAGFGADHPHKFWVLEAIMRDASAVGDVRSAVMPWWEGGRLAINRYVLEARVELPDLEVHLSPQDYATDGGRPALSEGIEAHAARLGLGRATRFTYDADRHLVVEEAQAEWSRAAGGPGAPEVVLPNGGYQRCPQDIEAAAGEAAAAGASVVFETGNVLGDGGVARWLVEYAPEGRRLFRSATYEEYPLAG